VALCVLTIVTVLEPELATYRYWPLGLSASASGELPTWTEAISVAGLALVFRMFTTPSGLRSDATYARVPSAEVTIASGWSPTATELVVR
jgi:hypothetical protein